MSLIYYHHGISFFFVFMLKQAKCLILFILNVIYQYMNKQSKLLAKTKKIKLEKTNWISMLFSISQCSSISLSGGLFFLIKEILKVSLNQEFCSLRFALFFWPKKSKSELNIQKTNKTFKKSINESITNWWWSMSNHLRSWFLYNHHLFCFVSVNIIMIHLHFVVAGWQFVSNFKWLYFFCCFLLIFRFVAIQAKATTKWLFWFLHRFNIQRQTNYT